jgi:hypothetical protein
MASKERSITTPLLYHLTFLPHKTTDSYSNSRTKSTRYRFVHLLYATRFHLKNQQLHVMIQGSEHQQHVAVARDNHDASILEEDATTLFTMSTDSSPSPSKDCLGGDRLETSILAIPIAGPVLGEDPVNAKEYLELRKVHRSAARRAAMSNNEAIVGAPRSKDMDGGDVNIKTNRRKVWEVCAVLTSIALVLIAAAVVVAIVHGNRGPRPSSQQDDSQDENSP